MKTINIQYNQGLWIARSLLVCLFPYFIFLDIVMFDNTIQIFVTILSCNLFLIVLICTLFRKGYQRTTIDIGQESITYRHDFLLRKRRDILFRDVKEIEMQVGLLQKFFGLGTIALHTHATVSSTPLRFRDLKDVENVSIELKQMTNQAKIER